MAPRLHFGSWATGWRRLGVFWLVVLLLLGGGGLTLQILGPPTAAPVAATPVAAAQQDAAPPPARAPRVEPPRPASEPLGVVAGRVTPGPIADPDPGLLETVRGQASEPLPVISADGRMPMQVYAAGSDRSSRRVRVGFVLAGMGLNQADSEQAIRTLPGGITLAFSPYAANPAKLLAAARIAEHEYLLSIPMEPQGYPVNDPGPRALMTNLAPEQNRERLDWALSRICGYVGVTGALGAMRGERFAGMAEQIAPVFKLLAQRGLLYVDPRPGAPAPPYVWERSIDIVIDEPPDAVQIDDKLAQLVRLAREKGSALGLAGTVRKVTTDRLAAWVNGLMADGLTLTPVSALVQPPPAEAKK